MYSLTYSYTTGNEYCAPVWHQALTKAQSVSPEEAVQKHAIHIIHNNAQNALFIHVVLFKFQFPGYS